MEYMLLIYDDEKAVAKLSEKERGAIFQGYMAFTEDVRKSGAMKSGAPLQGSGTATTLSGRNGKTVTTDGPFAETKEQLAGYYVVEAKNLDEALAIAAKIPSLTVGGSVEVRPVLQMGPPK